MELFYGKARCADCHSGKFQTDQRFHAIAMPQIGPGKGDGNDGAYWRTSGNRGFLEDFGRGRVTRRPEDKFKFRTPSLRNVAVTGPWGHSGAYHELEDVVRHHLDPEACLDEYDVSQATLLPMRDVVETSSDHADLKQVFLAGARLEGFMMRDTFVQTNKTLRGQIQSANELRVTKLTEVEIRQLVAFLGALTDPNVAGMGRWIPQQVPSQLPVAD